jgi:hypothetical protein
METKIQALAPLSRCAEICGLSAKELIVGSSPRPEHEILAGRYSSSSDSRKATMRVVMVSAIRAALKEHQLRPAAELLVALRMMLASQQSFVRDDATRRARRRLRQRRRPLERLIETDREERALASAVVVNLAERRATQRRDTLGFEADAAQEMKVYMGI